MSSGNLIQDYKLKIDLAKKLCMQAKTEAGERARLYFIECEKKLRSKDQSSLPSYAESLRQLADKIEQNEKLKLENKQKEKQILNLADDVHRTRLTKAKDYKTVDRMNKADIGNSINYLVSKYFKKDGISYQLAHRSAWSSYFEATGIHYCGASKSSYEEKLKFLEYLTKL
jgi:phage anti-repressor protein